MALISTKNIITPFSDKMHLATIILLVVLFAAFRLSGGELEIVHKDSKKQGNLNTEQSDARQHDPFQGYSDRNNNRGYANDYRDNQQNNRYRDTGRERGNAKSLEDIESMFQ